MRIVAGKFKGLTLAAPTGQNTRPTSDRVRQAIFNILEHSIAAFSFEDARVMDLFAGTGALGFEALSRGGRYCHFVDDDAAARGLIRRNADTLGVIGQCKIWRRDASELGLCAPLAPFHLVFADPPYGKGLGAKSLAELVSGAWLEPNAIVVLEESSKVIVAVPAGLWLIDSRNYGETQVLIYRHGNLTPAE
jgi:16S rRNA (guanine966-N2)-methyltransferase